MDVVRNGAREIRLSGRRLKERLAEPIDFALQSILSLHKDHTVMIAFADVLDGVEHWAVAALHIFGELRTARALAISSTWRAAADRTRQLRENSGYWSRWRLSPHGYDSVPVLMEMIETIPSCQEK